jgi:hypothetical protein
MTRTILILLLFSPLTEAVTVYPPPANKLASVELGDAIKLFMPEAGQKQIPWDFNVNAPVIWLTEGYEPYVSNRSGFYREGLVRINVLGKTSHVLLKKNHELAWTVTYSTNSNPAFGVESIEISPGITETSLGMLVAPCFGALANGCDFDPAPSFKHAGISTKVICEAAPIIGMHVVGYEAAYPGKQVALIRVVHSTGSAGTNSTVTLVFNMARDDLCDV